MLILIYFITCVKGRVTCVCVCVWGGWAALFEAEGLCLVGFEGKCCVRCLIVCV